jgi:hypothetical protein
MIGGESFSANVIFDSKKFMSSKGYLRRINLSENQALLSWNNNLYLRLQFSYVLSPMMESWVVESQIIYPL